MHLVWATGGGHGSGTSFQYKSTSSGAWQTLTSVIAQSSSDWGDVIVDVGTISDIKYRCHGGHWCKVGYFNVFNTVVPSCNFVKILRYGTAPYQPTSAKIGLLADSSGFSKLSDTEINIVAQQMQQRVGSVICLGLFMSFVHRLVVVWS